MDDWIRQTFDIAIKPKESKVVTEIEKKSREGLDCQVDNAKEAATMIEGNKRPDVFRREWIGRLSYQWFCMDTKLKVLHDLYPSLTEVPAYLDVIRQVNQRWKTLPKEEKQLYLDIATHQFEKEYGPAVAAADP